ncbi:MAG: FAD:protein FMN transferase [Patescibacteria group bacterium]
MKEYEYKDEAMGTEYSVAIVCNSEDLAFKMFELAKNDIRSYENRFSRFKSDSELSMLNKNKDMKVSAIFLDATEKAYELFKRTRGIFNPLVQVERLGYDTSFKDIKKESDKNDEDWSTYDIDFSETTIDKENNYIRLNEGQKLDCGGFLKGYLAEIIVKKIIHNSKDIQGVVVNLGGDISTEGADENGNNFVFYIYNPISKKDDIEITLHNQSLATSGTYKRSWLRAGKKVHHILDASGRQNPKTDIASVSIIHKDGAYAEAYAKVFLSMDYKDAMKLLDDHDVRFILIKNDGQIIKNINENIS